MLAIKIFLLKKKMDIFLKLVTIILMTCKSKIDKFFFNSKIDFLLRHID